MGSIAKLGRGWGAGVCPPEKAGFLGGTWAGWGLPALLLKFSESSKPGLQMGVRAGQSCFCEGRPGEEGQVGTPPPVTSLASLCSMGGARCPPHPSEHPVSSDTTPLVSPPSTQSPLSGSVLRHRGS